jgi:hypothetical protein
MSKGKYIKVALLAVLFPLIFVGGVIVGNIYNVTDILCPAKTEPYILEQDFVSKNGILIPKGTVIPLRKCAYMQRINYQFAIDNATELKRHRDKIDASYGFSELYPISE